MVGKVGVVGGSRGGGPGVVVWVVVVVGVRSEEG